MHLRLNSWGSGEPPEVQEDHLRRRWFPIKRTDFCEKDCPVEEYAKDGAGFSRGMESGGLQGRREGTLRLPLPCPQRHALSDRRDRCLGRGKEEQAD